MFPIVRQSSQLSRKLNGKPYDKAVFIKKPLLAITFDDGIDSDYLVAYPQMTTRGIKGTSYIVGSHVGILNKRMSWEQIKELQDHPMWDVQSHTFTHGNMKTLSEQELIADYDNQISSFETNGLRKPNHLAYPFGENNALSHQVFDSRYAGSRLTNYNSTDINTYENFDKKNVKSVMGDMNDDSRFKAVTDAIDYALLKNGLLTIYLHQITPNVSDYASSTARLYFDKLLDYVEASGIETVTISEMVDYANEYSAAQ